ncbi:PAS domain-containing protein [uncultured Ferrovibrio sp.]|jgi:Uncharacterized protein conserved in bacteria|uniref:PAS domain-containing protein n=1 Tax=uncultured Ferrovibrio sp. TaxID=1576913 RepID=UPI00261EB571|nr:PAS domain-containing protein [uncultured Ferrovibrio sp.]
MTGPNIGMVLDPELSHLVPGAEKLLAYWKANCGSSGLPDRSRFDPLSLRPYLGNLLIADVEDGQPERRFRYRLIGTDLADVSGRDMTGRYFEEIYTPASLAEMRHCFGWVVDHKQPARVFGTLRHANRAFVPFDGIFLPIATEGGDSVRQVIGYIAAGKDAG